MEQNAENISKIAITEEVTNGDERIQSDEIGNKDTAEEEHVNENEDKQFANGQEKSEGEDKNEERSVYEEEHEREEKPYDGDEQPEENAEADSSPNIEQPDDGDKTQKEPEVEQVEEEEEGYVEEPPPDPTAPLDFSESKENLKPPFVLRPDQLVEVEQLWDLYQNYTPAYTDLDGYITEKELIYMLKALILMTYTPEQLQELIFFCVKPPHPQGHINYNQFLKMVTLRQRDFPIEDELRSALQVFDPGRTGSIDREYLKEVLAKQGHKMPQKQLDNLIKEVDISNDGTIGIEDVVGTMCIDLNKDDILMLMASLNPPEENTSKHSF